MQNFECMREGVVKVAVWAAVTLCVLGGLSEEPSLRMRLHSSRAASHYGRGVSRLQLCQPLSGGRMQMVCCFEVVQLLNDNGIVLTDRAIDYRVTLYIA